MAKQVIVIGGGPAGLMAAGQAASMGAEVLLLEKMDWPGKKLKITGKGRCNITNIAEIEDFVAHFGSNGRFLRGAFYRFFSDDLLALLADLGVKTVTERGGRVFPASEEAGDVVDALVGWVRGLGVEIRTKTRVKRLLVEDGRVTAIQTTDKTYRTDAVIVATGGMSYPGTGSTGDGYYLAEGVGHGIVPARPALVPLKTAGDVAKELQGLSLRNVNVTLYVDGKKQTEEFGEMLFTHYGVSGPVILTMSKQVVDAVLRKQSVSLSIDLKPALDEKKLDARLLRDFDQKGKQHFQRILKDLLPQSLIPVCSRLVEISPDKPGHQITSEERGRLRGWLKDFRLEVTGFQPIAQAIVTAGGVDIREIDPRTMASRLVEGLYFAGEVIDIDADTGGYNLQAAFSTGWLAGRSAAGWEG
ncbi:MAG: NAD(P)/FAD-dependent oxidoreductase [Anaerolineae bacterium]|nr:NAD(P)/FAD-dependent oxidoreductase [Anaerolineae bacterium]